MRHFAPRLIAVLFLFVMQAGATAAQVEPGVPGETGGDGGGTIVDPNETGGVYGPDTDPYWYCEGDGYCYGPEEDEQEDEEGAAQREAGRDPVQARYVSIGLGRPELVISGPFNEFEAANAALEALGAELRRYRILPRLGLRIAAYDLPGAEAVARAQAALNLVAPNTVIGIHHIYDLAQGRPRIYAARMIGDAELGACPVARTAIGLIDGPVDPDHPALAGAELVQQSFLMAGDREPSTTHGTAVAALLVGEDPEGALGGFAPGAALYAVSAFTEIRQEPGADIERIATAIEWLLQQDVRLINMSFAGPENPVLAAVLQRAAEEGAVMIAAAGNDGRERAAYPAAHPAVIAVTAVDAAFRRYREANYGDHIEFAAPGVDLYVASSRDGSYASGTSYAAPIVTALAARLGAGAGLSTEALRDRLRGSAVDLGPDGFDAEFGWGLVRGGC